MDHVSSTGCGFVVDLEMCNSTSGEAGSPEPIFADKVGKKVLKNACNGDGDELCKAENGLYMNSKVKHGNELYPVNVTVFVDKKDEELVAANLIEKKRVKDKRKSTSAKKPPKPPRPPRGLSLDAADQKLIKEIAEIAMIKRARIERIKASKKMKEAKASSTTASSGSFLAFLFTVFFLLVLCFQGMSSGSSAANFHNKSGGSRSNRFIIEQYCSNLSASTATTTGSESTNLVEKVSDLDIRDSQKRCTS